MIFILRNQSSVARGNRGSFSWNGSCNEALGIGAMLPVPYPVGFVVL